MVYSQDPAYYTIGEKEFANTDIYTMLYDESTDVLYVGTNNGMYAYRRNEFMLIKENPEQIGSSFFNLKQNAIGNIFCSNMSGQIFRIDSDKMELIFNPLNSQKQFNSFYIYQDTKLIISTQNELIIIDENGNQEVVYNEDNPLIVPNETITFHGVFNHFGSRSVIFGVPKGAHYVIFLDSLNKVSYSYKEPKPDNMNPVNQFVEQKGKIYGVKNSGEFQGFGCSLYQDFEKHQKERVYSLDENTAIGLNSQKGFRYIYLDNDTLTCSPTIFDKLFISAFTKLENNVMLFGTFGEGIRVVSNSETTKSYNEDLFLDIASSENNKVSICSRSGEVYELINNDLSLIDKVPHNVDNIYYLPNNKVTRQLGYGDFVYNDSRKLLTGSLDIIETGKNSIFYGTRNALIGIVLGTKVSQKKKLKEIALNDHVVLAKSGRVKTIEWDAVDSNFYFSGSEALFRKKWNEEEIYEVNVSSNPLTINDLFLKDSLLFCSTQTEGLIVKNIHSGEKTFSLNISNGLYSNHVKKAEIKDELIFIITKMGLQIYNIEKDVFIGMGVSDGLESEKITNFALSNDKIWLIEKHSYLSIDLSKLKEPNKNSISTLYMDSLHVNNKSIGFNEVNEFDYRENAFTFYYDYRDLLTKKETVILYTLEGFYDDWKSVSTEQNEIEFQSLPVGEYTFRIKAKYRNQETKEFTYQFEIYPPFWQRWWFYVLVGLFTAGIIALIAFYRIRNLRKKNKEESIKKEMEKEAIDAQLKAIRAQMNPHFIFNAINSIQDLVLQQDTLKSYDYLVMFSKLVRNTLEYSGKEFISLEEELAFLTIYLDLEKLRFSDDFEYTITSSIKNSNTYIPSLIIQPFAENAIKHGLLHSDGKKRLSIDFQEQNNNIICTVEDNGVGYEESNRISERKESDHKSFSTDAIKTRLELLKEQTKSNAKYEITTLFHENENVKGTKVVITLPKKNAVGKK